VREWTSCFCLLPCSGAFLTHFPAHSGLMPSFPFSSCYMLHATCLCLEVVCIRACRGSSDENGYERILLISHLFSYFCLDSDLNMDSVNHARYNTIKYRHHKYAIWVFGYGYGIGCWISGLGYGQIWTPLNGFDFEYGQKISVPFSPLAAGKSD